MLNDGGYYLIKNWPKLQRVLVLLLFSVLVSGFAWASGGTEERYQQAQSLYRQARAAEDYSDQQVELADGAVQILEELLAEAYERAWTQILDHSSQDLIRGIVSQSFYTYIDNLNDYYQRTQNSTESQGVVTPASFEDFVVSYEHQTMASGGIEDRLLLNGFFHRFLPDEAEDLGKIEVALEGQAEGESQSIFRRNVLAQTEFLNEWLEDRNRSLIDANNASDAVENLLELYDQYIETIDHYDYALILTVYQYNLPVHGRDAYLSDIRLLLAQSLIEAREYTKAIETLSIAMFLHPQRFDDAEIQVAKIRNQRDEYNVLLGNLLDELQKDPNDPEDPFNETVALEYIAELEERFPEVQGAEIDELEATVKLAVDRGYRDRILEMAHQMILDGQYEQAIERYQRLAGLDVQEPYSEDDSSFELQREEFIQYSAKQRVSELYIVEVLQLPVQLEGQTESFVSGQQTWDRVLARIDNIVDDSFPEDPKAMADATRQFATDFSAGIELDENIAQLIASLEQYNETLFPIFNAADRSQELRDEFPAFLPEDAPVRDSEHLLYVQQFIAGPGGYDNEGIAGAADRLNRQSIGLLYNRLESRRLAYSRLLDETYESEEFDQIQGMKTALDALEGFALAVGALHAGNDASSVSLGDAQRSLELIRPEDSSMVTRWFLDAEHSESRNALASLAEEIAQQSGGVYAETEAAYQAYEAALELTDRVRAFSQDFLRNLGELSEQIRDADTQFASVEEQHRTDVSALVDRSQDLSTKYFQQYLVLLRSDAPQRLASLQEQIDQADRDLSGRENENGAVLKYPGSALEAYQQANEELAQLAQLSQLLQDEISQAPQTIRSAESIQIVTQNVEQIESEAQTELSSMQANYQLAQDQLNESLLILQDARDFRADVEAAIQRQNVDQADRLFESMDQLYLQSIAINADDDVLSEYEQLTSSENSLFSRIEELKIALARQRRDAAIEEVVALIDDREWILANDSLQDAKIENDNLPESESDPRIQSLQDIIDRGIILADQGELRETDANYSRLSTYLNNAAVGLVNARNARSQGNSALFERYIRDINTNLDGVFAQLPANFEAKVIELQLTELQNPDAFASQLNEEISEIREQFEQVAGVGLYNMTALQSNYDEVRQRLSVSDPGLAELLSSVRALGEFSQASGNRDLTQLLYVLRLVAGEINPLPWAPDIRPYVTEAQRLRNLAASNRNDEQSYRNYLEQALDSVNQALSIDPLSSSAISLRRQIVIDYSVFNQIVKLSSSDELLFSQAVDLLNSNQILEAEAIVRNLWYSNSDNQLVRKLRDLKSDIESATGRSI